ncbi:DUF1236 domain-containing protein [Aestuariivirga sp.]|uniref:DUF1236 domain-containing protein n=1 Tax=Aestuariivirga sp. TaxID=2650926 RepID=UPI003BAB2638
MKYLTISAAALFLMAAPGAVFAQDNTGGNNSGNSDTGNNGSNNSGGASSDNTGSGGSAKDTSQCSDQTATSSYGSFSSKCRSQIDAWATEQTGKSMKYDGELAEGATIPDNVEIMEVPAYKNYGYVMLNDKRVLVDRTTHKVIRVY